MHITPKKVALIILDGWGLGQIEKADAIKAANTPFVDSLYAKYPNITLTTFGKQVGLPEGQMGNSEVGHLNIGAGRIVFQDFLRINNAIKNGSFQQMSAFKNIIERNKQTGNTIHLMGLFSDGGVHSHINHLKAICRLLHENQCNNVFIHAFTDGRDTDPKGGAKYLENWLADKEIPKYPIASVIGRYYAMDRDKRWERIALAYNLLINGAGEKSTNLLDAINESYENGVTDEFIKPIVNANIDGRIKPNDIVLCFNFRTDRCRQITTALTQQSFPEYNMQILPLHYTTMTRYDKDFENINIVFEDNDLKNTLGEVLQNNGKTQLRAAETEKYPHVTFFFSGGQEIEFKSESRILEPSPKVATYDLQPEMSANPLSEKVADFINKNQPDFVCLNFANPDMVGHTGDFEAVKKAVETVDKCCKKVAETALKNGYHVLITADHGNADYMINPDGSPNTAHSKNPVPLIFLSNKVANSFVKENGKLADLAPTILHIMGINIPEEMDGEVLLNN